MVKFFNMFCNCIETDEADPRLATWQHVGPLHTPRDEGIFDRPRKQYRLPAAFFFYVALAF